MQKGPHRQEQDDRKCIQTYIFWIKKIDSGLIRRCRFGHLWNWSQNKCQNKFTVFNFNRKSCFHSAELIRDKFASDELGKFNPKEKKKSIIMKKYVIF